MNLSSALLTDSQSNLQITETGLLSSTLWGPRSLPSKAARIGELPQPPSIYLTLGI